MSREYSITSEAEEGGAECAAGDGETETADCNSEECTVNCEGAWTVRRATILLYLQYQSLLTSNHICVCTGVQRM